MKTKTNLLKPALLLFALFMMSFSNPNGYIAKHNSFKTHAFLVKSYKFGELRSGDCVMQAGGTLDIYSDGHAVFNATVWTNHTHSGDTWHHNVNFNDAVGGVIFKITLDGPNHMNDDGTHYAFSSSFNFPAEIYDAIVTVTVRGNC